MTSNMKTRTKNFSSVIKSFQRGSVLRNNTTASTENFLITETSDTSKLNHSHSVKFSRNLLTSPDRESLNDNSFNRSQNFRTSISKPIIRSSQKIDFKKQITMNIPLKQEKKFNLNDYIVLEENNIDLIKCVKSFYRQINTMLKGFGSDDLKEYLQCLWDIDIDKKDAKDLLPILEVVFSLMIKFYTQTEDENFKLKRSAEIKDTSNQSKDYLFLLQSQEAEVRAQARENQQLKISLNLYQEKLKNSEMQAELLANYAQKEMENTNQEFQYAINELKQREVDIDVLKKEIQEKDKQIESLDERLVSILILEHKIRALGSKNVKDIEKTIFEYSEKLKDMDKTSREAIRKERQENDKTFTDFKGRINLLNLENKKLNYENKSRIQQLNNVIVEKEQHLQDQTEILQDTKERLALRNKEVYLFTNQKDKFGFFLRKHFQNIGNLTSK